MRHLRVCFGLALASSATLIAPAASAAPPTADPGAATPVATTPGEVEPPEYPPPSTRWKVAGLGFGAAAVFYGIGAGLSYAYPDVPGMKDLRIPVVGPFIGASNSSCGADGSCTNVLVAVRTVLMVLDGVAQAGSLAVMLEGLFMPTQEAPAVPATETPRAPPPSKPPPGGSEKNLFFIPGPTTAGAIGIGVGGRF